MFEHGTVRSTGLLLILCLFLHTVVSQTTQQCGPRIRRSWASLTRGERDLFLSAIALAHSKNGYQVFADVHKKNFPNAHQTSIFLPWHRFFVWRLENYLRSLHSNFTCLTLPYWSWEQTATLGTSYLFNSADFGDAVSGCIPNGGMFGWKLPSGACITRNYPANQSFCGQACLVNFITSYGSYGTNNGFRYYYEGIPHASPHNWIGGVMSSQSSCSDPLFFMHHVNVDRIWALWQDCWDHDTVAQDDLGPSNYVSWDDKSSSTVNDYPLDYCLPYGDAMVSIAPECITPRMMYRIQRNTMTDMDYQYEDNNNMIALLNTNWRRCKWNWTWPGATAGTPPSPTPTPTPSRAPTPTPTPTPTPKPTPTPTPTPSPTPSPTASLADKCNAYTDCAACTGGDVCGWCPVTSKCSTGTSSGPRSPDSCSSGWAWRFNTCPCPTFQSCGTCLDSSPCGWCNSTCKKGTSSGPNSASGSCGGKTWYWNGCPRKKRGEDNIEDEYIALSSKKRSISQDDSQDVSEPSQEPNEPETGSGGFSKSVSQSGSFSNISKFPISTENAKRMPGYVGEFYSEADKSRKPTMPGFVYTPGKFYHPQLQLAKEKLDAYYDSDKTVTGKAKDLRKIRSYYVAECEIEGTTNYVSDEWLAMNNMEDMKDLFIPPCKTNTLPITLPKNARATGNGELQENSEGIVTQSSSSSHTISLVIIVVALVMTLITI